MSVETRDTLYAVTQKPLVPFTFDERVAAVFPDMAERSIPGYRQVLSLLATMATNLLKADQEHLCYDLGCSLGAGSYALANALIQTGQHQVTIRAVDSSAAMIAALEKSLQDNPDFIKSIVPQQARIEEYPLQPCSLVLLHYTLQFVEPSSRQQLLDKIYSALLPGGWLLIAEKIIPEVLPEIEDWHKSFKKNMGYSDLEISQKRQALERVMLPDTLACHNQRLQAAGFSHSGCWHQSLNFVALAARK